MVIVSVRQSIWWVCQCDNLYGVCWCDNQYGECVISMTKSAGVRM